MLLNGALLYWGLIMTLFHPCLSQETIDHELNHHSRRTYSIEGEDVLLEKIFYNVINRNPDYKGFYVDIGSFDAIDCSNTFRFYERGWTGVCVDPNPDCAERFWLLRPNDQFINAAVSSEPKELTYYHFKEDPKRNGFVGQKEIDEAIFYGASQPETRTIKTRSIAEILEGVPKVDILNIDVEGFELDILSAWDFDRCPVSLLAVEIHGQHDLFDIYTSDVSSFLRKRGFVHMSRLWHTSIFIRLSADQTVSD